MLFRSYVCADYRVHTVDSFPHSRYGCNVHHAGFLRASLRPAAAAPLLPVYASSVCRHGFGRRPGVFPAVLSTPSFGYLLGFIVAAPAEAFFRQKMQKKQSRDFLAALLGIVVIYAVALPYVAILKGAFLSAPVPFSVLMYSYFLVFLPLDLVKAFLAGLLGRRLRIALRMN